MKPVNVGLAGIGTVGSGTFQVLDRNQDEIRVGVGLGWSLSSRLSLAVDAGHTRRKQALSGNTGNENRVVLSIEDVDGAMGAKAVRYGVAAHYDVASAFIKSKALLWPLFYSGAFYLLFCGLLTIAFNALEKKLGYIKV